ncbi:MAG: formate C-acetyltransferase [Clostridia bacterium]|nr:formate C-acetyltransferase [Clostridia bacterium]
MFKQWDGFNAGNWNNKIDVRDFIQSNFVPYEGNESFLAEPTEKTKRLWEKSEKLLKEELDKEVLDIDTKNISGINNFKAGYLDKDNELILGFQTDAPLKRMMNPFGGLRMVEESLEAYGYKAEDGVLDVFDTIRKTHNKGVFDVYTDEIRNLRSAAILTGLPDAYGRGRIIGDYRRLSLYGADLLIKEKKKDKKELKVINENNIRRIEEISEEIRALEELKKMAMEYGIDISQPAKDSVEAVQFLYFAYLGAVKENNGAATSIGRISTFLDIYFERDIKEGKLTEEGAQELMDQLVMKLRFVRHLRTPDYNELFAGDPNWITESVGGMSEDGRTLVTKSSFRILHTLTNLSPAPEPNLTVLWSENLPQGFKEYCAKVSIETDSIQYESDDLMRPIYGDDYAIACCVSAMRVGKEMQFFGARCNLGKSLLYAINGGIDEKSGKKIIEGIEKIEDEILDYDKVKNNYYKVLEYVAEQYVNAMNIIHYMHDKYAYEKIMMAFHDNSVHRYMAFGVAGLSVVADSLSAIKYAKVKPVRENGIAVDYTTEGDFPKYGNDDDAVDNIALEVLHYFVGELKKHPLYRDAEHTLSVLTITSNVVYGKKTGATPDGRMAGEAFAPGANPMHGRDMSGALASLNSVAKIPYKCVCQDGVSNTLTIVPDALSRETESRPEKLAFLIDGYFLQGGHHLNINVLQRDKLIDAMENPEKYPNLTIRVSGYAVHFNRLTEEQKREVINRTFHYTMGC